MQVNIRTALGLVKARLNRLASDATLDTYFVQRIEAAEAELESTGISLTDSADDLMLNPGECAFSFSAQRACVMTVTSRGRFR